MLLRRPVYKHTPLLQKGTMQIVCKISRNVPHHFWLLYPPISSYFCFLPSQSIGVKHSITISATGATATGSSFCLSARLCARCLIKITCKLARSLFYIPLFPAENKETSCGIPLHSPSPRTALSYIGLNFCGRLIHNSPRQWRLTLHLQIRTQNRGSSCACCTRAQSSFIRKHSLFKIHFYFLGKVYVGEVVCIAPTLIFK